MHKLSLEQENQKISALIHSISMLTLALIYVSEIENSPILPIHIQY